MLWQSHKERVEQLFRGPRLLTEEPTESFALLSDWRTRFGTAAPGKDAKGKGKRAAVEVVEDGADAWEDVPAEAAEDADMDEETAAPVQEGEEGDGGGALESIVAGSGLDPQALMRALQENLAASGAAPAGLDQATLLKYALRMLSGEGEADDIAGELADDLFEQADGDDDPDAEDIAAWAAKQKGHVENGEEKQPGAGDDDDVDEASESEPKTKAAALPPTPPTTQPISREDGASTAKKGKKKETAQPAPASAAAGTRSRKRKAAEPAPEDEPPPTRPKRATRSYAAQTATSKAKSAGRGGGGKGKRG